MKMNVEGKARIEAILLSLHEPGPFRNVIIHESGEIAIVQIADSFYRYQLKAPAKEILKGNTAVWTDEFELFELI
jgi:hypothetical protein